MERKLHPALLLFLSLWPSFGNAQSVDGFWQTIRQRLVEKDYVRLDGGLQAHLQFNGIRGIDRRLDPLSLRLHANLQFDILGIKAPFTAAIADGNATYRLPSYAFYGISPTYKWITLHAGDRSLNFSPYTLAGHNIRGIGLELRPGRFYLAAIGGRLSRARAEDAGSIQLRESVYRRTGWGLKAGFDDGETRLLAMLFKARDDANSLSISVDSLLVKPEDNVVIGLTGRRRIGKLFSIDLDLAHSARNRDTRSPAFDSLPASWRRRLGGLFQPRLSSAYHDAFKLEVNFTPAFGRLQLRYERIDPGYRTLGALFFTNDLENVSLGLHLPLFQQKLGVDGRLGLERNNLNGLQANAFHRLIGSLAVNATLGERLSVQANWSNFSITNRVAAIRVPIVQVDSLVLVQTTQSAGLSSSYLLGAERRSVFTTNFSYQRASAVENDVVRPDQQSTFYLGLLAYTLNAEEQGLRLTASVMANYQSNHLARLLTLGPALQLSKALLRQKLLMEGQAAWSIVTQGGLAANQVLTLQTGATLRLGRRQSLGARLTWVRADAGAGAVDQRAFREFTAGVQYGWRFGGF